MQSCPIDDQCKDFADSADALRLHIKRKHIELLTCHCGTVLTTREKLADHQAACPPNQPTTTNHQSLPSTSRMGQSRCDDCKQYKTQLAKLIEENRKLREESKTMATKLESVTKQLSELGGSVDPQVFNIPRPLTLNALPWVVLRKIFAYLSPKDVLQMARVCPAWKSHQKRICRKVRSITLLVSKSDKNFVNLADYYHRYSNLDKLVDDGGSPMNPAQKFSDKWFEVWISSLCSDFVRFLAATMSNVDTLQITITEISFEILDQVIELINLLSSRLITLKVECEFSEDDGPALTNKVLLLFESINSLPKLEHLTLTFNHALYPDSVGAGRELNDQLLGVEPHFEMSILSGLHEFNFFSDDWIKQTPLFYSLKRHVPSNQALTQIRFINAGVQQNYSWLTQQSPNIASRMASIFVHIENPDPEQDAPTIPPISHQFTSLTEIICFIDITLLFSQLINIFSSLKQLERLILIIKPSFSLQIDDNIGQYQIGRLTSLKILTVFFNENTVFVFDSTHWGWALPNVQILELVFSNEDEKFLKMPQIVQTFMNCPKLRFIFTKTTERGWKEWMVVETAGQKSIQQALEP